MRTMRNGSAIEQPLGWIRRTVRNLIVGVGVGMKLVHALSTGVPAPADKNGWAIAPCSGSMESNVFGAVIHAIFQRK